MVCCTFNHEYDIFHQLAKKNLKHILDQILSYLDTDTLTSVEMVSPLWSNVVNCSNVAYRLKVIKIRSLYQYNTYFHVTRSKVYSNG